MNSETIHDSLVEENIVTNIEYVVYFATVENNKCIPLLHNICKYAESDHIISFFKSESIQFVTNNCTRHPICLFPNLLKVTNAFHFFITLVNTLNQIPTFLFKSESIYFVTNNCTSHPICLLLNLFIDTRPVPTNGVICIKWRLMNLRIGAIEFILTDKNIKKT